LPRDVPDRLHSAPLDQSHGYGQRLIIAAN
jgi:hypothetical protein